MVERCRFPPAWSVERSAGECERLARPHEDEGCNDRALHRRIDIQRLLPKKAARMKAKPTLRARDTDAEWLRWQIRPPFDERFSYPLEVVLKTFRSGSVSSTRPISSLTALAINARPAVCCFWATSTNHSVWIRCGYVA